MIQKTPEEKAAIKAAKKSWKQNGYDRPSIRIQQKQSSQKHEPKPYPILTGLLEGENPLPDDYPVYWDYVYVADTSDGNHQVIMSEIKGTVNELKNDIFKRKGYWPNNIYNCKRGIRNLF